MTPPASPTAVAPDAQARAVVDSLVDAQSLGQWQDQLLLDPSPERDSALEVVDALEHDGANPVLLEELRGLLGQIRTLNHEEGRATWSATGIVDGFARRAHKERSGRGVGGVAIQRRVGKALGKLIEHDEGETVSAEDYVAASSAVRLLCDELPAHVIFTSVVEKHLRRKRLRKLEQQHELWAWAQVAEPRSAA